MKKKFIFSFSYWFSAKEIQDANPESCSCYELDSSKHDFSALYIHYPTATCCLQLLQSSLSLTVTEDQLGQTTSSSKIDVSLPTNFNFSVFPSTVIGKRISKDKTSTGRRRIKWMYSIKWDNWGLDFLSFLSLLSVDLLFADTDKGYTMSSTRISSCQISSKHYQKHK